MTFIIISLIVAIVGGIVTCFFQDDMIDSLYDTVFVQSNLGNVGTIFDSVGEVVYGIALSLITLKFLKKAFEIYVLWTDGDPDADPMLLLTNYIKAIAGAIITKWVYEQFVVICRDIVDQLLGAVNTSVDTTAEWINSLASLGLVPAICGLIFFIVFVILYFQFIARGVEMKVMEIGIPLACCGLLDNDRGVYRAYINQFVKAFVTTIVQIILLKIGLSLCLSSGFTADNFMNSIWGIACELAALSMPKILREFLVPTGGEGKISNTVFQTVRIGSMAKNMFK